MRRELPAALSGAAFSLVMMLPAPVLAQAYFTGDATRRTVTTTGTVQNASAGSPRPGTLGGGFIEFLVTGRDPSPGTRHQAEPERWQRQATPRSAPQPEVDPFSGLPVMPPGRQLAAVQSRGDFERPIERVLDPRFERQEVAYDGPHRPGTVVIDTPSKFLYLVLENGRALRYGIGVGRPGFEWAGVKSITRKAEWPDWTPPAAMLKRRPDLPRFMPGGPENPMGARAMYLGSSLYRIHGTNEPHTIGQAVSSGCIRMTNEDVTDLYNRVRVGMRVIVI
ncbi:MAG: L,D-transpeptidase [Hyphomicrobiales bacterium]|jgi:lipoprotein-anchoring transpeptidase ErfK/SrfK|nr:L,D-transpeptidase [Hyphomicrobiales bacterium]